MDGTVKSNKSCSLNRALCIHQVGLLNYPNADIPAILDGVTSGTLINGNGGKFSIVLQATGDYFISHGEQCLIGLLLSGACGTKGAPFDHVPSVGFSDIESYYNDEGNTVIGEFYCLSDNGYGSSSNSADYALNIVHMKIQKPFTFRHGESTFEKYTPTENLGTALIHDPNGYIKWENGADIQVEYSTPDGTWDTFRALRVLTGRDFDVEGLAVLNQTCGVVGDELMPAIFAINPLTGIVMSPFVRLVHIWQGCR